MNPLHYTHFHKVNKTNSNVIKYITMYIIYIALYRLITRAYLLQPIACIAELKLEGEEGDNDQSNFVLK